MALRAFTVTVHEPLIGIVPPVNVTEPGGPTTEDATPPQVVAAAPLVARFAGKVSVKVTLVAAIVVLGLVRVMVSSELVFKSCGLVPKDLVTIIAGFTVSVAVVAATSIPPAVAVNAAVALV